MNRRSWKEKTMDPRLQALLNAPRPDRDTLLRALNEIYPVTRALTPEERTGREAATQAIREATQSPAPAPAKEPKRSPKPKRAHAARLEAPEHTPHYRSRAERIRVERDITAQAGEESFGEALKAVLGEIGTKPHEFDDRARLLNRGGWGGHFQAVRWCADHTEFPVGLDQNKLSQALLSCGADNSQVLRVSTAYKTGMERMQAGLNKTQGR